MHFFQVFLTSHAVIEGSTVPRANDNMLSLPASKPQSPHKGSLGISLREDHTETRLMLSLPAAQPHSPHKRSLGIILREEKARLMLSLPVCKSRSPPERSLVSFLDEDQTETRLMLSLAGFTSRAHEQSARRSRLSSQACLTAKLWHSLVVCDASSMKVAFFQVQPCSSSILRGNRTVSTVPGLCDSEIWHFLVVRRIRNVL